MSTINCSQKAGKCKNPLRDPQEEEPAAWCRRCRGEIYPWEAGADGGLCPVCREERENRRKERKSMTLLELSAEYRSSAQTLRLRITQLEEARPRIRDDIERICMDDRIKILETMWREARDLAVLTERYYDRGYRRNAKYTI